MLTARHAVVVGLDHGDEGKGKVVAHLAKLKGLDGLPHFHHCVRFNGGPNAGHTIYLENGRKAVTHIIPSGVVFGLHGIIGKGCVLNVKGFLEELKALEEVTGKDLKGLISIDPMVHIITDEHVQEDIKTDKIGSTKRGIAPVYSDKMLRKGTLAKDVSELAQFVRAFVFNFEHNYLFEGAQGFYLDPDHGDYPYVTSSGCLPHHIHNTGFPYGQDVHVFGVCKPYSTYVGTKEFGYEHRESHQFDIVKEALDKCAEIGAEFGATTGRKRKIDILKTPDIFDAAVTCGVNTLIINKIDVAEQAGLLAYDFSGAPRLSEGSYTYLANSFASFLQEIELGCAPAGVQVIFSRSPHHI